MPALLPIVSLFMASALPGSAALIAWDAFNGYNAGALNGQGKGFGWSNNWSGATDFQVTTASGLTHSSNTSSGGTMNTGTSTAAAFSGINRNFATPISATGDVYFGFLMQQPTGNSPRAAGISLSGGASTQVFAGAWDNTTFWQLTRNIPTNQFGSISTTVSESTATIFFVLKMELTGGNDTARLFVNPANAAALTGAGNASYVFTSGTNNFAAPTGLSLFRQNQASGGVGNVSIDEVRVGTAAADMFTLIPEPSTALLGALGLLGLLRRRR